MESKLPDISNIEDIVSKIRSPHWELDKKAKSRLLNILNKLNIDKDEYLLEIIGILDSMGLEEGLKYLNQSEGSFNNIIRNCPIYDEARRKYFLDLTAPMRELADVLEGINPCPKCGSHKTKTRMVQTRAGDEGTTEFNSCICGNNWVISG